MNPAKARCLILACGNALRTDDGVGPRLADWAEEHFANDRRIRVVSRQQWTPDLAADLAGAESALFLDCSVDSAAGAVQLRAVTPQSAGPGLATHHAGAAELLSLAQELYGAIPRTSLLLTIGAGSTDLGETFSSTVEAVLPEARQLIEQTLLGFLI